MKKQVLAFFLGLSLAVPLLTAPVHAAYKDVAPDHWAAASIESVTEAGIFQGTGDGVFGLGVTMNRAQYITALGRLMGWETVEETDNVFSDVKEGDWYYDAVLTAYANDALPAYSTTFRPYDAITREEMVSMLVRGLGYSSLAAERSQLPLEEYTDVTSNKGFIAIASDMGLVKGYEDNTFRPKAVVTREQAAVVFDRTASRLHSESTEEKSDEGRILLTVPTPEASAETALPETPLEPLGALYDVLREAEHSGVDLTEATVVFSEGGVATQTRGSKIVSSKEISKRDVDGYLRRSGVKTYYHESYGCPYLVYTSGDTTTTVWYQSEDSLKEKLALCRLFGVTSYLMEK